MPRATKHPGRRLLKAPGQREALRVQAAELECQRAEKARDAAQAAVTAAYIELGRALLAGEIGNALRSQRGRR